MYQVWIKNEFNDEWALTECETLDDVRDSFLESLHQGQPTMVTQRLEVSVEVKVTDAPAIPEFPRAPREPKIRPGQKKEDQSEVTPGGPKGDRDPGDESHGPV